MRGGGPRTQEGRERIAEYQRERWRRFREEKAAERAASAPMPNDGTEVIESVLAELNARSAARTSIVGSATKTEPRESSSPVEPETPAPEPETEPAWLRNRRIRDALCEAENERGRELMARYGDGSPRPMAAQVGYSGLKQRRRGVR